MKITVVTKIPSPYQVELFDRIAASLKAQLVVVYLRRKDPDRSWAPLELKHTAYFLEDRDSTSFEKYVRDADLTIFGWYRDPTMRALMRMRHRSAMPWCFWGERPGWQFKGFLGRTYRRLMLWDVFANDSVAIWGIGRWAIEGYKTEFGERRRYYHVPYVSDLRKFLSIPERRSGRQAKIVLFSGSLIERKGALELCEAFLRLAPDMPQACLQMLGSGPLEDKLRRMASGSSQVKFLGFLDWNELQHAYASADILCAPSRYDGWGLIVIEGLASGLPVIATSSMGSAYEVINEGENGWLVPARSVDALEDRLRKVLSLPAEEINSVRRRCRESAIPYSIDIGTDRFLNAAKETFESWKL